jgi:DNA-binding CsgD family transcriptional regulator
VDDDFEVLDRSAAAPSGAVALLEALTTRRFCAALLAQVNAIVRVDHCAVIRLTPDVGVQVFGAESFAAFARSGARAVVRYIDRHHRFDPVRRLLVRRTAAASLFIRRDRASDVTNPAYRRDCYEAVGIVDRIAIASRDSDGGVVSLELKRQASSGEFTQADVGMLNGVAPLLAAASTRHVELLMNAGVDADAWRTRLAATCSALTARELDVAAGLLAGWTLRACASRLGLAHSSIVTYCKRAYARLGVRGVRELRARFAGTGAVARRLPLLRLQPLEAS